MPVDEMLTQEVLGYSFTAFFAYARNYPEFASVPVVHVHFIASSKFVASRIWAPPAVWVEVQILVKSSAFHDHGLVTLVLHLLIDCIQQFFQIRTTGIQGKDLECYVQLCLLSTCEQHQKSDIASTLHMADISQEPVTRSLNDTYPSTEE